MPDIAISEFAADGSTGPSRMTKLGAFKFMDLEGQDFMLFDLSKDPYELNNLVNDVNHKKEVEKLSSICEATWNREEMYDSIQIDQQRRLKIHETTGGDQTYVNIVRYNDGERYIRNAGAADTKAERDYLLYRLLNLTKND